MPVLLLVLTGGAQAQTWRPLGSPATGWSFDNSSVVVQADARIASVYRNIPDNPNTKSGLITYLMNCTTREVTTLRIDGFAELDLKGKRFPELQTSAINRTTIARPDSAMSMMLTAACEVKQTARVGDTVAARPPAAPPPSPHAASIGGPLVAEPAPAPAPASAPAPALAPVPAPSAAAATGGVAPLDGTDWARFHSQCAAAATQGAAIAFRGSSLYLGTISKTQVAVRGKGRAVCTDGVATGKSEESNYTIVQFEDGLVTCLQYSDESRLAVERVPRTLYRIMGEFAQFSGNSLILKDCSLERVQRQ